MKVIAFLSLHPGFGGTASANANIVKMLCRSHKVFFIDEYLDSTRVCIPNMVENLTMIHFPIGSMKYCPWKINVILKQIKPDYIIVGSHFIIIFYWLVLFMHKLRGSKIITVFHSLTLGENFKSQVLDILVSFSSMVSNCIIFVSKYTKKSWCKFPWFKAIQNKYVISNAVNVVAGAVRKNKIETIAYVGRLTKEKQPQVFCEIAKQAQYKLLPYKFILWGEGPLKDSLLAKYSKYIIYKGVSDNKNEIYEDVDLLLLTSKFENCPMVLLESKVRGIPAICPSVGGIPEIINDGIDGKIVADFSINKVIEQIETINRTYSDYTRNCFDNSLAFTFERIGNKWNGLIN